MIGMEGEHGMKLICCAFCGDVVLLDKRTRRCACKRSGGKYMRDGQNASIFGPCSPIGIDNRSLAQAMMSRYDTIERRHVNCFVINEKLPDCHVRREESDG